MRHFSSGPAMRLAGLGRSVLASDAASLRAENDAARLAFDRAFMAANNLLSAPFVTAGESARLANWIGRAAAIRQMFVAAVITDTSSGRAEVNAAADNVAFEAQTLLDDFESEGFSEIQRRATMRTAMTGFVVVSLVGAGLWYVAKKKRSSHG